jgi:hypothetical protein
MSYLCTPIPLAQVMVRMQLDCLGRPNGPGLSAFTTLAYGWIGIIAWAFLNGFIIGSYQGANLPVPAWVDTLVNIRLVFTAVHFFYMCAMFYITRQFVRKKYSIPTTVCSEEMDCHRNCEDCCFSCICTPCSLSQMHRHTADYSKYEFYCCTQNGLGSAPVDFETIVR